jgi:aldose 1-epimerase
VKPASVSTATDAATGWTVVTLGWQLGGRRLGARLAPAAGGNLFSLTVGQGGHDQELLLQPEALADLTQHRTGTPVLFPTPNRVRGGRLTVAGRELVFPANSGDNFIHGLARDCAWQTARPRASATGAAVDLVLPWDDTQPQFPRFPFVHRLTVTYTLHASGLRIAYAVKNEDAHPLPFGFGLHPFFRAPADRGQVLLQVPTSKRMEAVDKLPTGRLLPAAGSFDLRKPRPLPELDLDDVYCGLTPARAPAFVRRDLGLRVSLGGSAAFTHFVVYTPPGRPFFCMENQTCSTDAHNLHAAGRIKEAHLLVVPPGKTSRGFVDWIIRRAPASRVPVRTAARTRR